VNVTINTKRPTTSSHQKYFKNFTKDCS